jgi:hypothetical protein
MDLFDHYSGFSKGQRVRFRCLGKERAIIEGTLLGFFDQGCPPCSRVDAFVLDHEGTRHQVSASSLIRDRERVVPATTHPHVGITAERLRKLGLPSAVNTEDGCVRLSQYDAETLVNMVNALYSKTRPEYS